MAVRRVRLDDDEPTGYSEGVEIAPEDFADIDEWEPLPIEDELADESEDDQEEGRTRDRGSVGVDPNRRQSSRRLTDEQRRARDQFADLGRRAKDTPGAILTHEAEWLGLSRDKRERLAVVAPTDDEKLAGLDLSEETTSEDAQRGVVIEHQDGAVESWEGLAFHLRSDEGVGKLVERDLRAAGLDPDDASVVFAAGRPNAERAALREKWRDALGRLWAEASHEAMARVLGCSVDALAVLLGDAA